MYSILRRFLFSLPPETAHRLTLSALRFYGHLAQSPRSEPPIVLAGIEFASRVGLAAGLDKDAIAVRGLAALGFGFIEVGTVTPEPQSGNPQPRLFRLVEDHALINRMGFNNRGAQAIADQLRRAKPHLKVPIGVNIGKNRTTPISHAVHDYRSCMTLVYPHADYLTVNLSSPNTPGLRDLQSEVEARRLLGALVEHRAVLAEEHRRTVPLFVKVAPDLDTEGLQEIAGVIVEVGCEGIIATNTTVSRPSLANPARSEAGGLSGAPLNRLAQEAVRTLRAAVGPAFPIIGVGGISSVETARAMFASGADLIQLYTAFIYQGPNVIGKITDGIEATASAINEKSPASSSR